MTPGYKKVLRKKINTFIVCGFTLITLLRILLVETFVLIEKIWRKHEKNLSKGNSRTEITYAISSIF